MQRLDRLLLEQGLCATRTQAQNAIHSGRVRLYAPNAQGVSSWQTVTKPGLKLPEAVQLEVTPDPADRFVSRGALKLAGALEALSLDVSGMTALDVGQSTGGFTDALLQSGVSRVVGVDVGHDQLHPKLKADPRVTGLEGINARALPIDSLHAAIEPELGFDLIVMDVSFISQTLILPGLPQLLKPSGHLISLVKPQFEVGREHVGKGGIVRDTQCYQQVKTRIIERCETLGLNVQHWMESPIQGGDGNREFLLYAQK